MEERIHRMTLLRDKVHNEWFYLANDRSVESSILDTLYEAYKQLDLFCIKLYQQQRKEEEGGATLSIAPFPFEQIGEKTYRAKCDDVENAAKDWCIAHKREVPQYVDSRAVRHWFTFLGVVWNGETPVVYEEDSEESPWIVEWSIF